MRDQGVDVVIPALNEPYLPTLLKQRVFGKCRVSVRGDRGLSLAVWRGIQESHGKVCVVMDGDGSHPPERIWDMVELLDSEIWLVVGSRYCDGGYSRDGFVRQFVSRFYCLVARVVLGTRIRDSMSGFWVGYPEAFRFEPTVGFKFGLQLIRNIGDEHIREFPIVFEKRKCGKSHVKPLQALKDLLAIVKVRVS